MNPLRPSCSAVSHSGCASSIAAVIVSCRSMATRPASVLLLVMIATACGPRGKAERETAKPSPAHALACPKGTTFAGEGPPAGRAAWCVDAQGRQHGPTREWFDDGTV